MKVNFKDERAVIIDNFLPDELFDQLATLLEFESYEFVNGIRWNRVFRLLDGRPLAGRDFLHCGSQPLTHCEGSRRRLLILPSGTVIDEVLSRLSELPHDHDDFFHPYRPEPNYVGARPWIYPTGTGLSWHDDRATRVPGFILYCHPEWSASWGGELLVADSDCTEIPRRLHWNPMRDVETALPYGMSADVEISAHLMQSCPGLFVLPAPNRLVILQPGVMHAIKRVETAAGERSRRSLSGQFMDMEAAIRYYTAQGDKLRVDSTKFL